MDKSAQRYIDLAFEYHVAAITLNTQIFDAPYLIIRLHIFCATLSSCF